MSIRKYAIKRWHIFADSTTFHGVKQINRAPVVSLKVLWAIIVIGSFFMMSYQIVKLSHHYSKEPVTTTVGVRNTPYPVPLFLFVAHTQDLFPPCTAESDDPERKCPFVSPSESYEGYPILDYETLTYARSLVDFKVLAPKHFKWERAKNKFDQILINYNSGNGTTKLTYQDLLKPYMNDISTWIETGGNPQKKLRVVQRSFWSIATYYMVEPAAGGFVSEMHHDFQIETPFRWENLSVSSPRRRPGNWVSFVLTSYGLLTDAIRFEPGRIIKVRFDIQTHKQAPLRRKKCKEKHVNFKMYDEQKCNETCFLKAEQKWMPRTCYVHKNYEWGFYEMYKYTRPCSAGFHYINEDGALENFGSEPSQLLPGGDRSKMREEYQRCLDEDCIQACELLDVKVESSSREFGLELGNKSLLYVTWPAVNAVTAYEVGLQYTWDGFVGQLGGLVGLWMGASTMSLVEAFYLLCCCCYDVRRLKSRSQRRPNAVSTSFYRSNRDEEMRHGDEYQRNGSYNAANGEESSKLKTTVWYQDETKAN